MLFDRELMFSIEQDLSQVAATYTSTNVLDFGAAGTSGAGASLPGNQGLGTPINLSVTVVEAFAGATATVNIQVIAADDAALSTNAVTLVSTGATAVATLVAGYKPAAVNIPLPPTTKRFLGMKYVIATATTTAGTITAGLTRDRQSGGGVVL